ncbi:MAG: zinc-binding alcohol dehydrogenase [Candidatus Latescibacteria bacterium]|nr:zinc-binding alcohol dehydrogenase [Candidatus Latescibacterota bacterium]
MKQIVYTAAERAELLDREPDQRPLAADEVAGPTLFSLISPGTELANYTGLGGQFPFHPGYASVFRVEQTGAGITDLPVGSLVFCMGPHAAWQRAQRRHTLPLPAGLAPEIAPFARLMSVSMSTLTTTLARPPAPVLVTGLGPVGHLAAQLFAACGYRVTGCDPVESRRRLLAAKGIEALAELPVDQPGYQDLVELVVECSGHEEAALGACKLVRKRGEVVLVGAPWKQRSEAAAHALLHPVFFRFVTLRSGWEWELAMHPTEFRPNSIYGNIAGALDWLQQGRVRVDGIYQMAAPAQAQEVFQDLLHRRGDHLSAVFAWNA